MLYFVLILFVILLSSVLKTAKLVRQETPATAHPLSRMYIVATAHTQGRSPLHCLHTVRNKRFFTSTLSVHW